MWRGIDSDGDLLGEGAAGEGSSEPVEGKGHVSGDWVVFAPGFPLGGVDIVIENNY